MKADISKKMVLLTCILIGLLVMPACAEEDFCITRNAPDSTHTGNTFEVTLSLNDLRAGGIIETIPSGMTFVSTTHPEEKYELKGQQIIFSVIDDENITYTLRAGSTGTATISGIWDNALTKQNGKIADTSIKVYPDSDGDDGIVTMTSMLVLNAEGNVGTPIHLKSTDQCAVLDIPVDVCAHDRDGNPINEVGIANLRYSEIKTINGTEFLFEDHIYRFSPAGAVFSPAINLSFTFTQEEWDSFPEGKVFQIRNYDPEKKAWILLPTTVDEGNRTICTSVTHFSIFGVFTATQADGQIAATTGDITSQNDQIGSGTQDTSKSHANVATEKTETLSSAVAIPDIDTPDKIAENSAMNPLFFGAALIVAIIAIAAILVMGKNEEKKEEE